MILRYAKKSEKYRNTFIHGNALTVMKSMPSALFHQIDTSVPYWSKRIYGTEFQVWGGREGCKHNWVPHTVSGAFCKYKACGAWFGEYGMEPTPELYIEHSVLLFREAYRVLRKEGTMFVNIGDTYYGGKGRSSQNQYLDHHNRVDRGETLTKSYHIVGGYGKIQPKDAPHPYLKPKDLVGIPFEFARALRNDGWYWRGDLIWHKPNPMPSSARDRPTMNHEYILFFAKKKRYFYDSVAVREPAVSEGYPTADQFRGKGFIQHDGNDLEKGKLAGTINKATLEGGMRNRRSVWTIATNTDPTIKHYAMFPDDLMVVPIKAGTSERGVCPKCGRPWRPIVAKTFVPQEDVSEEKAVREGMYPNDRKNGSVRGTTSAVNQEWEAGCKCNVDFTIRPLILDPFMGSGTLALTAYNLNRHFTGIDLMPENVELSRKRLLPYLVKPKLF